MADSSRIHFEGEWPTNERALVMAAAAPNGAVAPRCPKAPGAPWIVLRKEAGGDTFYVATRLGRNDMLTGQSAAGLADRIRRLSGRR